MNKRVALLGSTGSIGCSTLDVIQHLGPPYRALALGANRQVQKLADQTRMFNPEAVALVDPARVEEFRSHLQCKEPKIYAGAGGLVDLVHRPDVDIVLSAVVGAAGLPAALACVKAGKPLALANKESLVVAGSLLIPERGGAIRRCCQSIQNIRQFSRRWLAGDDPMSAAWF